MKLSKKLLIDAIIGGTPIQTGGIYDSLITFCGNQWNENWHWNREALEKLTYGELKAFYENPPEPMQMEYTGPPDTRTVNERFRDLFPSSKKILNQIAKKYPMG